MAWTINADGDRYCVRHDVAMLGALDVCAQCVADPGPAPADAPDVPLPPAPDGCESTEAHERKFTALAEFSEAMARELARDPGKAGTAAKLIAEAVKARRAAAAIAKDREQRAFVAELEKRRRRGS